jgi:hypothetical protein
VLAKELTEKTDETKVDLEAIRMSVDKRTKSLLETVTHTKKNFHEEFRVETQTMKALIEATRREFQT